MAYIGNAPADKYTSYSKQTITGNGTVGPYTLDYPVANANELEVFVNNVRQEPTVAYSASGTSLTMTGTVASTDDFYVLFQGKAVQTVVPPDGSVTAAMISPDVALGGPSVGTDSVIRYNAQTISEDITVPASSNGFSAGPMTIATGYTVTITSGSYWTII